MAEFHLPATYYDPPDDRPVIKEIGAKTARARKEYVCDECYRKIKVGETYTRVAFSVDGEIQTGMVHGTYCHPYAE